MQPIEFIFGVHNHQPVGNFDHVFQEVFDKCYSPYVDVLTRHPKLKTAVHFSGPLLEWLKERQPDYIKRIAEWVAQDRLEILSGGFYEPILAALPERDAIGQIQMMNDFIQQEFGYAPRGLWLAERIWSPDLPRITAAAGLEFTVLDDTHFLYAGLEENQIQGYFVTEKHGCALKVFPISKALRYSIPFQMPDEILGYLRHARDNLAFSGVTYADDGEKFGSWPDTYDWVYKERWLEKFFSAMESQGDWMEMVTFGDYIDRHPPQGRIYLPLASYEEMMEWSLPTRAAFKFHDLKEDLKDRGVEEDRFKIFLRGGLWENFFTKYEESNQLHKKMLDVSRKVNELSPGDPKSVEARRELYRSQCNCAQWHGLFGGLYLNHLRHALYQHLIMAENIADAKMDPKLSVRVFDYDMDGREEAIVSNHELTAYIQPGYGGALRELDYRPACFNLSNVLRRREETYHKTIREAQHGGPEDGAQPQSIHDRVKFKQEGLHKKLIYDRWERYSFLDHFLGPDATLESFQRCQNEERGDFVDGSYELKETSFSPGNKSLRLKLARRGAVTQLGAPLPIAIEKTFTFQKEGAEIKVEYVVRNLADVSAHLRMGVEFNWTLLAGDAEDRYYFCPGRKLEDRRLISQGVLEEVETFGLRDDWHRFELEMRFPQKATLWRFPVETISQSEDGFERTYQGSCLLAHWAITLEPGQAMERAIGIKVGKTSGRSRMDRPA